MVVAQMYIELWVINIFPFLSVGSYEVLITCQRSFERPVRQNFAANFVDVVVAS